MRFRYYTFILQNKYIIHIYNINYLFDNIIIYILKFIYINNIREKNTLIMILLFIVGLTTWIWLFLNI